MFPSSFESSLDSGRTGVEQQWFKGSLPDTIRLPGTTDEAGKGEPNTRANEVMHLSRVFPYSGPAWYQHIVEIPAGWAGKRITLLLERTKHTTVWVDEQLAGSQALP